MSTGCKDYDTDDSDNDQDDSDVHKVQVLFGLENVATSGRVGVFLFLSTGDFN